MVELARISMLKCFVSSQELLVVLDAIIKLFWCNPSVCNLVVRIQTNLSVSGKNLSEANLENLWILTSIPESESCLV